MKYRQTSSGEQSGLNSGAKGGRCNTPGYQVQGVRGQHLTRVFNGDRQNRQSGFSGKHKCPFYKVERSTLKPGSQGVLFLGFLFLLRGESGQIKGIGCDIFSNMGF